MILSHYELNVTSYLEVATNACDFANILPNDKIKSLVPEDVAVISTV